MQLGEFKMLLQEKWKVDILEPHLFEIQGEIHKINLFFVDKNQDFINHRIKENQPKKENNTIYLRLNLLEAKSKLILHRISAKIDRLQPIFARKTTCLQIEENLAVEFLNANHFLGFSGKHFYGLFVNGELMAVATFSNARNLYKRSDPVVSHELEKFAVKAGYHIVGGLSKLIKKFQKDFSATHIMTYADLDWGWGFGFESISFEFEGVKVFDKDEQIASAKWILSK